MNSQLVELWGNSIVNMAKGQEQLENINKWISNSFSGFDKLTTSLFKSLYNTNGFALNTDVYFKNWEKSIEDAEKSFRSYLSLVGVVPKKDHLQLVQKYEDLKRKNADQEETIKHLRMLHGSTEGGQPSNIVDDFEKLIKTQSRQFQDLMNATEKFFSESVSELKENIATDKPKAPAKRTRAKTKK